MTSSNGRPVALVTGASSGIGEATVRQLAAAGYETISAARRLERCEALAAEVDGRAMRLDVTDAESIERLAAEIGRVDVVVHSAGGALGLDPIAEAKDSDWIGMFESNVLGVMRLTRALLPKLEAGEGGHIVVIGSIAGFEVYPGGGGYTAAKHGANAIVRTLRLELLGKPIRVTEIQPGAVETEFSLVRFDGDEEKAANVYRGLEPLVADDVAELTAFAITRPKHVNVDTLVVRPVAQATARDFHREE
ncbi:SDR family NAD(P)-dependent oxidoreductase [Thermoleophilia bacterium SCSIO 60948]|nr:SDR family NAD(P)-dependent oxidoreductase [Thermoleophilia bacterium SCSIO 60948]